MNKQIIFRDFLNMENHGGRAYSQTKISENSYQIEIADCNEIITLHNSFSKQDLSNAI